MMYPDEGTSQARVLSAEISCGQAQWIAGDGELESIVVDNSGNDSQRPNLPAGVRKRKNYCFASPCI